jgi:hypothetical protein
MKLELTDEQINNLIGFLRRANMSGDEAELAYAPLIQEIKKQIQEQENKMTK